MEELVNRMSYQEYMIWIVLFEQEAEANKLAQQDMLSRAAARRGQ